MKIKLLALPMLALALHAQVTVGTITPASGTGNSQLFTATFTDNAGAGGLTNPVDLGAFAIIVIGTTSTPAPGQLYPANSCTAWYYIDTNQLGLVNDAGNSSSSTSVGGASVSNSQCTLDASQSTFSNNAPNFTVGFHVTFKSGYTGAKNTYLRLADLIVGGDTGYVQIGTWTVAAAVKPTVVSLTPNSISVPIIMTGQVDPARTVVFTGVVQDSLGAADITEVGLLVTGSSPGNPSSPPSGSCAVRYNTSAQTFNLDADQGGGNWGPDLAVGYFDGDYNSQCLLLSQYLNITASGNQLSFNIGLVFESNFGTQIYVYANSSGGSTGYVHMGTVSIVQPAGIAIDNQIPINGQTVIALPATIGDVLLFQVSATDQKGVADIQQVQNVFAYYDPATHGLTPSSCVARFWNGGLHGVGFSLLKDDGVTWNGTGAPGGNWSQTNSTCRLMGLYSTVTAAYNTIRPTFGIRFVAPSFGQDLFESAYAVSVDGVTSTGYVDSGRWNVNDPAGVTLSGAPTIAEPLSTITEHFYVHNEQGQPVSGVPVSVGAGHPWYGSGAHLHELDSSLPRRDEVVPPINVTFPTGNSGKTDFQGKFTFTIKLPAYAGQYVVTGYCSTCINLTLDKQVYAIHIDPNSRLYTPQFPYTVTAPLASTFIDAPKHSAHDSQEYFVTLTMETGINNIALNYSNRYSKPRLLWIVRGALPDGGTADSLVTDQFFYAITDWHNFFTGVDVAAPQGKKDLQNLLDSITGMPGCSYTPVYLIPGTPVPGMIHVICQ
jgi:hypothetical protein